MIEIPESQGARVLRQHDLFVFQPHASEGAEKLARQAKAPVPPPCNWLIFCGGAGGSACQSRLPTTFSAACPAWRLSMDAEPRPSESGLAQNLRCRNDWDSLLVRVIQLR